MMSTNVVPFSVLKSKIDSRDTKPAAPKQSDFSPEAKADELASLLVAGLYQGLNNCKIDPLERENHAMLDGVYQLVSAITKRHYGVQDELNATYDVQTTYGEPFVLVEIGVRHDEEGEPANG